MSWNVQLLGLIMEWYGIAFGFCDLLYSFALFESFFDLVHEFKPVRWSKLCKQQDATSLCFEVKGCHRNKLRLEQLDMLHQRCWQEQQPDLREMMPGWDGRCESLEAPGNLEIDKASLKMFESCCVVSEKLSRWTAAKPRSLGLELCCTSCSRSQLLSWLQRRKRPLRKQWRGRLLWCVAWVWNRLHLTCQEVCTVGAILGFIMIILSITRFGSDCAGELGLRMLWSHQWELPNDDQPPHLQGKRDMDEVLTHPNSTWVANGRTWDLE